MQSYENFIHLIEAQDKFTAAVYIIIAKIISGVFFVPATPLTILSGAMFGTFVGSIISIIGNLAGAVLAFFLARYIFKDFVQKKILIKYPMINKYEDQLFTNGFKTVIFLRLVPLFPYNFLNFALAVTEVKFKDFFWGSFWGMIPGTVAYVYFGESVKMLSVINIIFSLVAIGGLIYLGKILKK